MTQQYSQLSEVVCIIHIYIPYLFCLPTIYVTQFGIKKEKVFEIPTIYYWGMQNGNIGHLSLELSDGIYISHWPKEPVPQRSISSL